MMAKFTFRVFNHTNGIEGNKYEWVNPMPDNRPFCYAGIYLGTDNATNPMFQLLELNNEYALVEATLKEGQHLCLDTFDEREFNFFTDSDIMEVLNGKA